MTRLAIEVSEPLVRGGTFVTDLSGQWDRYTHAIRAVGGYWEATIVINDNPMAMEDWIANGIGRHIEVFNEANVLIWEGFVSRVRANNLQLTLECRGYVHWLGSFTYSSSVTGTEDLSDKIQNVLGADPNSTFSTDYGKITTNTLAVKAYEQDNKTAWDLILGLTAMGDSSDNRYIFGIYEGRQAIYEQIPSSIEYLGSQGSLQISRGPLLEVANQVDLIYSTIDTSVSPPVLGVRIATGSTSDAESQSKYGVIEKILSTGGSTTIEAEQIRGTFLQENKEPQTTQDRLDDALIEDLSGNQVQPWNVKPGRWLSKTDFLIGQSTPADLHNDLRAIFIESVTYNAPYQLSISGGKVDTLPQLLAKYGLAGVGA